MEKRIASFRDQVIAGMIAELLRQNGFHPRPIDFASHISVAGAGQSYDLWLPEEEELHAQRIIQDSGYGNSLAVPK